LMIANFQQPTTSCLVFSSNDKEGTLRSFVGTWGRRGFCLGNITAKILAQTPIKPPSSLSLSISLGNITAKILAQTPINLPSLSLEPTGVCIFMALDASDDCLSIILKLTIDYFTREYACKTFWNRRF
jgi:hypothetical protein